MTCFDFYDINDLWQSHISCKWSPMLSILYFLRQNKTVGKDILYCIWRENKAFVCMESEERVKGGQARVCGVNYIYALSHPLTDTTQSVPATIH